MCGKERHKNIKTNVYVAVVKDLQLSDIYTARWVVAEEADTDRNKVV